MSDKLYFEELTLERVLDILDREDPLGVVVSVGGQTSNNLALPLAKQGIRLIGTSANSIDRAEDRSKFSTLLDHLGIPQPYWSSLTTIQALKAFGKDTGYPILIRPSYVLSGAAMRVAYDEGELVDYVKLATEVSSEHPIVVSKFFLKAKEVEVDAVSDGRDTLIGSVIEHIEFAGTHSGDASMVIPPQTLSRRVILTIQDYTRRIARALNIKGPFNIQFIVKNESVYIIECNLRASRSIPYTSKAMGIPMIWIGAKVMLGKTLRGLNCLKKPHMMHVAVKVPTFSFMRLKGVDPVLGVEMTSTGEVACIDYDFASAYLKALRGSNLVIPKPDKPVLISVREDDRKHAVEIASKLKKMNFELVATEETANVLEGAGISDVKVLKKLSDSDSGDSVIDYLRNRRVGLIIHSPTFGDKAGSVEGYALRRMAVELLIPMITNIGSARVLVNSMEKIGYDSSSRVILLNDLF
jgi:carbamoyl-phosphate synthase large subunit